MMKKHSIKRQLTISFIGLILVLLMSNLLINNFFLEKYYIYQKENALIKIYEHVNEYKDLADYQTEAFEDEFLAISGTNNVEMTVLWPDTAGGFIAVYESQDSRLMRARVEGYLFGFRSEQDKQEVLLETDTYRIQRCKDSVAKMEYLEAWGVLDTGCYFLMRNPIQSIKDNVRISNQFTAYIIFAGIFVAIIMVWIISKQISDPILELTQISKRMANLEFDVKYQSGGKNEIGQLGENFNQMSEILEKTISELKTANNELQNDLEQKIQVDEMRKEFLSNVSHELKTPIALIQGYAEGLQECVNDDEQSRAFYCDVIIDEAAKMNTMVRKLLTLNQLEFGNDVVNMEYFNLTELVQGVLQSQQVFAQQKGADLQFPHDEDIYAWGDEFKIEEVVTNYISNALNHVSGENLIRVTIERIEKKVRVSVYNTGSHIPEEDLDKVWIKFYKVDKARTREYGGSGIGLSIVKAIMDSHHQDFGVRNETDGVTFWFELDGYES
ncbi:MAG: ATP-binding protein [Muricoprocola sp.]